jgi:ribosomal protein L11 methyltransferase
MGNVQHLHLIGSCAAKVRCTGPLLVSGTPSANWIICIDVTTGSCAAQFAPAIAFNRKRLAARRILKLAQVSGGLTDPYAALFLRSRIPYPFFNGRRDVQIVSPARTGNRPIGAPGTGAQSQRVTIMKSKPQRTYVRLQFDLPAAVADEAAAILVANRALGCEVSKIRASRPAPVRTPRQVRLKAYFDRLNDADLKRVRRALESNAIIAVAARLQCETLVDPGWATMWMTRFEPFIVGSFLIVPPWNHEHRADRIRLMIQPGQGFGTGHHGSTYGVLRLIDDLCQKHPFRRALDVGTGSGILAIAMRLLGVDEVTAIDIDPVALENARENGDLNHVSAHVRFSLVPIASLRRHFDLITANILSSTLIEMAPRLLHRVAPEGRLILAGILAREAESVIAAYRPGMRCIDRRTDRGWTALVLAR